MPAVIRISSRFWQCTALLNASQGLGTEDEHSHSQPVAHRGWDTDWQEGRTSHSRSRSGLSLSLGSVIPGRPFHAAETTNGKYTTAEKTFCPRAQGDSHGSSCCSEGSQPMMGTSPRGLPEMSLSVSSCAQLSSCRKQDSEIEAPKC